MFEPTKLMTLLVNKMAWQNAKTEKSSHNIANAETPGYKRREIKKFSEVLKTNLGKMKNDPSMVSPYMEIKGNHEIRTGEEVTRDMEVMLLAENSMHYNANLQLFKKYLGLMKTVIGRAQV